MKTIHSYIFFLLLPLLFVSCDRDGDIITLSDVQEGELLASASNVVLSNETAGALMLSLTWNTDSLKITHSDKYGISETAMTNTLQLDTLQSFANPKESIETGVSKSFTGSALNSLVLSMGLKPGKATTIYARLKSSIGANMKLLYSNVVSFTVTPYDVISFLYMPGDVSGGWNNYTTKLCSPSSNGEYEGYVAATQWANFKFCTEPNNTTAIYYGSLPNSLYTLDSSSSQWNIWFDEGGYFLVKANTNTMTWSKTAISSFCITGEFNGWSLTANPMTYNSVNKVWTVTCNISTVLYGIQIIANQDWNFKYGDNNNNGVLTLGGSNIVIASPGTYTITMDLSKPEKYTYTIK